MPGRVLSFSINDYPDLDRLVPGQLIELKIRGTVGTKVLSGNDSVITITTDSLELAPPERRMSPQEVMLAAIASNTESQPVSKP